MAKISIEHRVEKDAERVWRLPPWRLGDYVATIPLPKGSLETEVSDFIRAEIEKALAIQRKEFEEEHKEMKEKLKALEEICAITARWNMPIG